jgi:isochorismate synthase EntC
MLREETESDGVCYSFEPSDHRTRFFVYPAPERLLHVRSGTNLVAAAA